MKKISPFLKSFAALLLIVVSFPLAGQAPAFDEMEFEPDSVKTIYKPSGKNYINIKSKRGNSGVNKTAQADAILTAEVTEIVLVFSETESSDLAEREEANRERWENLLMTYPELFQFSTTYKNVCQCKIGGDAELFKQSQGFYVYVNGEVPKVAEAPKAPEPPAAAKPKETPPPAKTAKVEETKSVVTEKEVAVPDRTAVKTKEPAPVTPTEKPAPVTTPTPAKTAEPVATKVKEEAPAPVEEEEVKPTPKKKVVSNKPRRAKDPKACRPACYGLNDEDLHDFFKANIPLTKKERKKAKNWMAQVRLQINFDGTVKKAMVTGQEETFNLKVQEIIKTMNPWNTAVRSGVAVKSEVRFTLKYDKESKSIKPFDMIMNPKASPKCPCVSDSEIFAD